MSINFVNAKKGYNKVVKINELKPLQIGIVQSNGDIVMRTQSCEHYEVMNLSNPIVNGHYDDDDLDIDVEISDITFSLEINNRGNE